MGSLSVNGLDALISDMDALAALPDSVTNGILDAAADVIVEEQRKTAQAMGVYDTGVTARSIKKGKIKKTKDGKTLSVSPMGKNKRGTRNAEVAFVNEYGKRGQPARPFIRTANERAGEKAAEAGEEVYGAFLDRHGL